MLKRCHFPWLCLAICIALICLCVLPLFLENTQPIPPMAAAPAEGKQDRNSYTLDFSYNPASHILEGQAVMKIVNTSEQAWDVLCFADWASADTFTQAPSGRKTDIRNAILTQYEHSIGVIPMRDPENPCKWTVPLDNALLPEESVQLAWSFSISIPENHKSFGYSGDECRLGNFIPQLALWNGNEWVVHRHSDYSESAVSTCADFQLTIHAPENMTVICTGKSETKNGVTYARAENVRDFAVIIGEGWRMLEQHYDDVLVRCYYKGSALMGREALTAACDSLGAFGSTIGRYPYSTLNIVSAAIDTEGMEYPQLVMLNEKRFAWSMELIHGYNHDLFRKMVAHEVAHQWFYGIIGNDQFAEPWLDEGFATYLEKTYSDYVGMHNAAMYTTVTQPVNSSLAVLENAYAVKNTAYIGGASFLFDMQEILGDEVFRRILQSLYQENGYGMLSTSAALDAFRSVATGQQIESLEALIEIYFSP